MSYEQLKAEAARLPAAERFALAEWLESSEEVRLIRHAELVREVMAGIAEADRGELFEADEVFRETRALIDGAA